MGKRGKKVALTKRWYQLAPDCSRAWDWYRRLGTYLGYLYARFQNFPQRIGVFPKPDMSAVPPTRAGLGWVTTLISLILHAHVSRAVERNFY